jgi:hypothetical protein
MFMTVFTTASHMIEESSCFQVMWKKDRTRDIFSLQEGHSVLVVLIVWHDEYNVVMDLKRGGFKWF